MNEPLSIGLIGCGRVAERYYLPALARLPTEARLIAAADSVQARARLATTFFPECRVFSSASELLQYTPVRAVIIATPPASHVGTTIDALRAGLPVLVEKPLATCSAELGDIEELGSLPNTQVMMAFNQRHWEPVCRLKEALQKREATDEFSADLVMMTSPRAWSSVSTCSDALEDLAPHLLDLLRYLFQQEISAVRAVPAGERGVELSVVLAGGQRAKCLVAHGEVTAESILVRCNDVHYRVRMGSERFEPADGFLRSGLDFADAVSRRLRQRRSSLYYSYERQLLQFLRYLREGSRLSPDIRDGLAVLRAVEAARQSLARAGTEVPV
jgi:predicted dehydrogenase